MSSALADLTDAMSERDAVVAADARHRPAIHSEHHGIALRERDDGGAGLHAWPLFRQHELAALEVAAGFGQKRRDLQRKNVLAVEVLVQAVVVAGAVSQQQWGRPRLPRRLAAVEEGCMVGGKPPRVAHPLMPAVGDRREARIERAPEVLDQRRQRIGEIAIFALSKAVPRHDHVAAEALTVVVEAGDVVALLAAEQAGQNRPSLD